MPTRFYYRIWSPHWGLCRSSFWSRPSLRLHPGRSPPYSTSTAMAQLFLSHDGPSAPSFTSHEKFFCASPFQGPSGVVQQEPRREQRLSRYPGYRCEGKLDHGQAFLRSGLSSLVYNSPWCPSSENYHHQHLQHFSSFKPLLSLAFIAYLLAPAAFLILFFTTSPSVLILHITHHALLIHRHCRHGSPGLGPRRHH